jgi:serine/threonine protein kinase
MTSFGTISAGLEPIPGYILRRRLGAGGFGEVWLADAPGGLKKAVKIVYGTLDQERAASELRSLQRIRQVTHPFLLSLERIEIVNSQIVIVTELAECSVQDRYQLFRNKDLPGIPRDLLLEYLRDAADALDFISQKHELQHLDVKPGNLLLIADRIKVADFGLVKDLHERNQSLVGGLTPSYAAPEIFDGRPNHRSDQYSLAIVFQEMLTGQMPFNGRTTAELARQHLSQAPDLTSLPPSDRPIILRGMSKNPLDRFSSCRQLIDQLSKVRSVAAVVPQEAGRNGNSSATKRLTTSQPVTSSTATEFGRKQTILPRIDVDGNCQTWISPRCLFIGLGGLGCSSLSDLYQTMAVDIDCLRPLQDHAWMAIDTDADSLDAIVSAQVEPRLPSSAATQIQLYKPQEYRTASPHLFRALSRRWLYNIPRSLKTEGVRPLGLLAMLDHFEQLKRSLSNKLEDLVKSSSEDPTAASEPIRVYLISSAHGGTGSAMIIEMGYLIRDIFRALRWHNYRLIGNLTAATTVSATYSDMAASSSVACLTEISHCMKPDTLIAPLHFENTHSLSNPDRPFDWVVLHDGGLHGSKSDAREAAKAMAESIWLDSQTMLGSTMDPIRTAGKDESTGWLRTQRTVKIRTSISTDAAILSRSCIAEAISRATLNVSGSSNTSYCAPVSATFTGDMPLTPVATNDIIENLLDQLNIHFSDPSKEEEFLTAWVFRLSDIAPEIDSQYDLDIKTVYAWLRSMVGKRVYNWKQIEKLQLVLIERLMNEGSDDECDLINFLSQFDFPGTASEVRSRIQMYLQRLAQGIMQILQQFQIQEQELRQRLASWENSLKAEQSLADSTSLPRLDSIPTEWQQIAVRTVAVMDNMFQRLFAQSLDAMSQNRSPASETESVNLPSLLILSRDLCERFARELRITLPTGQETNRTDVPSGIPLNQLEEFLPQLSACGGSVYRSIVVPQDQAQSIFENIKKLGLAETTTIVPSALSRTSYIATEGLKLNLAVLANGLWRPTNNTLQLAERLLTRVDVEWPNVSSLLAVETKNEVAGTPECESPAIAPIDVTAGENLRTEQINV